MSEHVIVLTLSFFFIALVYASVGFGGGSSYLALLAQPIFLLLPDVIRPVALICNILVVTGATIIFYREKAIVWREIWPFLVTSVPAAYLGGFWKLKADTFFIVLSITLLLAAIPLWLQPERITSPEKRTNSTSINMGLGAGIGFLSGLVGIGGGIFLSPVLHFLRWGEARKISAAASLFILVNSISGLTGQYQRGFPPLDWSFVVPLMAAVLIGGQIGSWLGVRSFNPLYIKRITAVLIFIAGLIILEDHL